MDATRTRSASLVGSVNDWLELMATTISCKTEWKRWVDPRMPDA